MVTITVKPKPTLRILRKTTRSSVNVPIGMLHGGEFIVTKDKPVETTDDTTCVDESRVVMGAKNQ